MSANFEPTYDPILINEEGDVYTSIRKRVTMTVPLSLLGREQSLL